MVATAQILVLMLVSPHHQVITKTRLVKKPKRYAPQVSTAHLAVCQLQSPVRNNSSVLQAQRNRLFVLMDMFVRAQLLTHRKRQLCVQLDTFAKQVSLHHVGQATFANQAQALQLQLMVRRVTFVLLVTSVQLEQHSKRLVLQDITILTKVELILLSARFAQQEQPAPTLVHLIQLQLLVLRVTFVQPVLKYHVQPECTVLQAL